MISVRGRGRRTVEVGVGGIPPSDNDDPLERGLFVARCMSRSSHGQRDPFTK
jgi:hypothetical protein